MFQFRAFPSYGYLIHRTIPEYCSGVLPHSEISGSTLICSSPKLFAACHVLHRLLMPRHSPCALFSLTLRRRNLRSISSAAGGEHPFRSASFSFPIQTRFAGLWIGGGTRFGFPRSGSQNYAGSTEDLHKIVFTLTLLENKVSTFFAFKLRPFQIAPSVALLFHLLLCSVFKVQFRRAPVVENSGIEPLTS